MAEGARRASSELWRKATRAVASHKPIKPTKRARVLQIANAPRLESVHSSSFRGGGIRLRAADGETSDRLDRAAGGHGPSA
jgi:hypothetical protein